MSGPTYAWSEWPRSDEASSAMAHTGIAVTLDGDLVTGAVNTPALSIHAGPAKPGRLVAVVGVTELHDLTVVEDNTGREVIWIADTGTKLYGGGSELEIRHVTPHGCVIQVDPIDGRTIRSLERPPSNLRRLAVLPHGGRCRRAKVRR